MCTLYPRARRTGKPDRVRRTRTEGRTDGSPGHLIFIAGNCCARTFANRSPRAGAYAPAPFSYHPRPARGRALGQTVLSGLARRGKIRLRARSRACVIRSRYGGEVGLEHFVCRLRVSRSLCELRKDVPAGARRVYARPSVRKVGASVQTRARDPRGRICWMG